MSDAMRESFCAPSCECSWCRARRSGTPLPPPAPAVRDDHTANAIRELMAQRDELRTVCESRAAELEHANACHDLTRKELREAQAERDAALAKLQRPEVEDFLSAVVLEAAHQLERWGAEHDARKGPEDWFWTLGYLSGKALAAALRGDREKALHHTISSAALLANWHARLAGQVTRGGES
jgi:hypothetical protein